MPKTRAKKEETVQILKEKLEKASSVIFTDYKGLTMTNLSDLRNKLSEQLAEFTITKNSLLELALKSNNQRLASEDQLEGPTATLFSFGDEVSPIKILVKTLKDTGKGKIKGGLLGNEALDTVKIIQLSTLPSKEELRAKTVGILAAPLQGMVGVLQGNLRNLVYALDQIRITKGGD